MAVVQKRIRRWYWLRRIQNLSMDWHVASHVVEPFQRNFLDEEAPLLDCRRPDCRLPKQVRRILLASYSLVPVLLTEGPQRMQARTERLCETIKKTQIGSDSVYRSLPARHHLVSNTSNACMHM